MAGGIIGNLLPSFRSQIGHDGDQICNIHHFAPLTPPSWRGVQMVEMPYLRTTSDDSSSETCFVLMDDVTDELKSPGLRYHQDQLQYIILEYSCV